MVVVDIEKCVACGRCEMLCPREAIRTFGFPDIDPTRCTDCFEGLHDFEENVAVLDREELLDKSRTYWRRACLENCPMEAYSVKSHARSHQAKRWR